ncbi:hypothetical protein [Prosthecodimorpha staleyi]|uniref:Uncharacterized protein n=1 Tax=Prosthecodimorpha staleyi TaxID=2840188 RepID=A0A947D102_9HYPH|nr:hypothetical protein [Prosthecodimorpha staleyi]MBT9288775.1 hypothetical protein [Prosthecodimorpha staleyi]
MSASVIAASCSSAGGGGAAGGAVRVGIDTTGRAISLRLRRFRSTPPVGGVGAGRSSSCVSAGGAGGTTAASNRDRDDVGSVSTDAARLGARVNPVGAGLDVSIGSAMEPRPADSGERVTVGRDGRAAGPAVGADGVGAPVAGAAAGPGAAVAVRAIPPPAGTVLVGGVGAGRAAIGPGTGGRGGAGRAGVDVVGAAGGSGRVSGRGSGA